MVRDSAVAERYPDLYHADDLDPDASSSSSSTLCRPRRVHLSVGVEPWNSVTVSFSIPKECPSDASVVVEYEATTEDVVNEASTRSVKEVLEDEHGTSFHYSSTNIKWIYQSDRLYHVPLTDLEPSRTYEYRIVVTTNGPSKKDIVVVVDNHWEDTTIDVERYLAERRDVARPVVDSSSSSTLTFSTTAAPGTTATGTRMAIVADLGQTYNATVTMLHLYEETLSRDDNERPASIVLCGGDCSYADANPNRWDSWFDLVEPLVSRVPLQVAVGNHECECDGATYDMFVPYDHHFRMPNPRPSRRDFADRERCEVPIRKGDGKLKDVPSAALYDYDYGNSYYAFVHGLTHVVVLNCYAPSHRESRQYAWLVRELRAYADKRATTVPWSLVMVHCPLYNTFKGHAEDFNSAQMLEAMEPLFLRFRVNFVVSGHAHGYSRSRGVARGRLREEAPVHITVGEGGCREGHSKYRFPDPEPWVVTRDNTEFGFGTMDFVNATTVRWRWIHNVDVSTPATRDFTDEVVFTNQWYDRITV